MKNFKFSGQSLPYTAGADIVSGDPVEVGEFFGVAKGDIANGSDGELQLTGVVEIPKNNTVAFSQGDPVYWDGADSNVNDDSINNKLAGYAYKSALAADEKMLVMLKLGAAAFNGM